MRELNATATKLGLDATKIEVRNADQIVPEITALNQKVDALYVVTDSLVSTNRMVINSAALAARLPTMHSVREYLEGGGLISYGPSYTHLFRRAGDYVDKILRGSEPGLIPVEAPTKFEFIINLKTAKALGLTVSEALLARADEVIE
jgi:putative ABC transport system substrate-binding protein